MVLRCSLLGHDFGEPEIEREREERGSEVVVTVREYETCARCGEVRVVSESTEVTSLPVEPESAADSDDTEAVAEAASAAVPDDTAENAELLEADESVEPDVEETPPAEATEPDVPTDDDGAPITDDAEILEADDEPDDGRAHGEWPASDDVGPPVGAENEPSSWPEADDSSEDESAVDAESIADDEPVEDEPIDDDAVFVDAEEERARPTPGAGVTDSGTGIASAQSAPAPGESRSTDPVAAEYFCPRCSFVAPATRGSLRQGDICPECRKGYLGERERQ